VTTTAEHRNWTAVGADTAAQNTYASIKKALEPVKAKHSVEIFLQGSYANHTNIRADSDVDIVVMSLETWQGARDRLGPVGQSRYDALPRATYTESNLRADIEAALVSYYGRSLIHPKNKCLRVDRRPGYVDADVVPCLQYRYFDEVTLELATAYKEGIAIHPLRGGRIINFPKEHIKNGRAKNGLCNERYKPTVRQVKRLRNRAVDLGLMPDGIAPGYLLECMVFNAPTSKFVSDESERLQEVVLWLKYADKNSFMSCDKIHRLFHTDPGQFSSATAQRIIDALWGAY
jgi:hypothetical protein